MVLFCFSHEIVYIMPLVNYHQCRSHYISQISVSNRQCCKCLQCFDAVGWVAGRASGDGGVLAWLSVWSEMQTCIWPSWCHCHSLSLASVKSGFVLPFWYRLTRVVPEKGPLNVCVCVCVIVSKHLSTYVFLCTWCLFSEFCCFCCCPFSYLSLYLLTLHSSAMSILTAPRVYIEALHVLWWGVLCICVMEGALHVCVDETVNSVLSYFKRSAWLEH